MSLKDFTIQTLNYFKNKKYPVKLNNNIFNPLAKDTILFNNSGIVGIYEEFDRYKESNYNSLFTIQKCLRITGKHNDFNSIQDSKIHSTCFYMCGLFGIKNYNAEKLIRDIYDFITEFINKDNLYITIHPNDTFFNQIWKKIDSNIRIEKNQENTWSTGTEGFNGQCTEIIYCDNKQDIEIWNIVHITHIRTNNKDTEIKNKFLDTGGGLERLYLLKYNLSSIYEIPEYRTIINRLPNSANIKNKKIAIDGIKSIDAICYNNIPVSNNKQGYVLKKIIRRTLFVLQNMKMNINAFVHICAHILTSHYQALENLLREQITFNICLKKFYQYTKNLQELTEEDVLYLHTTYGIHYYITELLVQNTNLKLKFEMNKINELLSVKNNYKNTNFKYKVEEKYRKTTLLYNIKILKLTEFIILNKDYFTVSNKKKINFNQTYYIITQVCNVFPKMGGQCSDKFIIKNNENNIIFNGIDAYKEEELIILKVQSTEHKITKEIFIIIDQENRNKIAKNHSLTHIISDIISTILCEKIVQTSSQIEANKCKLSFSSYNNLQLPLEKLEEIINTQLKSSKIYLSVNHLLYKYAQTQFKKLPYKHYPKYVQVVTIYSLNNVIYSKEICGGTHNVEIQQIKIKNILKHKNNLTTTVEFNTVQ